MNNEEFKQALEAAENGNIEAMLAVATVYAEKANMGDDSATNADLMLSWLQKAAARGNTVAQKELTGIFEDWSAAAARGDAGSLMTLSFAYLKGIGIDADYKKAVFWAKKANAAKGNVAIKLQTKGLLVFAEAMLPAGNFRELMEGAQKGNANFQYALGFAYLRGFGIEVDPNQAVFWFDKAAGQKHTGALQTLTQVKAILAFGGNDFDTIAPSTAYKGAARLTKKHPILLSIIIATAVGYLAMALNSGWLYSLAIFLNVCWILYLLFLIATLPFQVLMAASQGRKQRNATVILICLCVLLGILCIGLSVHYIRGRKTENPVSIVLQNPFEAARKRLFGAKNTEPPIVELPVVITVTATVTSGAANIRSEPDGSKNNVIIQVKSGDILTVTGPVERGWLPVEVDGKPGYVSADLVTINDD